MPARPLPVLAVSLLFGSLTGAASIYLPVFSILSASLLLAFLFILMFSGRCKPAFACLIYFVFLCGMISAALTQARTMSPGLPYSTGAGKLDLIGEIAEPVRYGPSRAAAIVSLRRILATDHAGPVDGRIRLTMRGDVLETLWGSGHRLSRCIQRTVVVPRWRPARARIWAIFTFPREGQRILKRFTR